MERENPIFSKMNYLITQKLNDIFNFRYVAKDCNLHALLHRTTMIQSLPLSFYSFALLISYLFIDAFKKPGIVKFYRSSTFIIQVLTSIFSILPVRPLLSYLLTVCKYCYLWRATQSYPPTIQKRKNGFINYVRNSARYWQ